MRLDSTELAVTGYRVAPRDGVYYTHCSFGRILTHVAEQVRTVHFHAPRMPDQAGHECDFPLTHPRIRVYDWGPRSNSLQALTRPIRLIRQYRALVRSGNVVFLRGGGPLLWTCHWMARSAGKPVIHWLISNPLAALRASPRGYAPWVERLGRIYARADIALTKWGLRRSGAAVLANGEEVSRLYASPNSRVIVSTSMSREDFRVRDDTCTGPVIRLLYVGFIRPEKGLEYLLRALPSIRAPRPVTLTLVGSYQQFPAEYERLVRMAHKLGCSDRVRWVGYIPFGAGLFEHFDAADILVLPSLSEGTPRVLVEARARSLPVVSTCVGGVPDSVSDGQDGLLVPPRDPEAMARAIERIITEEELRKTLIRAGRKRVAPLTIESFVEDFLRLIERL